MTYLVPPNNLPEFCKEREQEFLEGLPPMGTTRTQPIAPEPEPAKAPVRRQRRRKEDVVAQVKESLMVSLYGVDYEDGYLPGSLRGRLTRSEITALIDDILEITG